MNGGSLFNPAGSQPILDGLTPVFVETGADPTAGLDLPPGSVAHFGADWFWKFGKGPTDWAINPFSTGGGGGGATVATWTVGTTTPRYFAIDPTNGSDASAGFSDISAALAWGIAKKTYAGFLAIFPQVGAGRSAVVLNGPATMGEDLLLTKSVGYDTIHFVGTTDGSDSAADRILSGAATALAGPNGNGSFTATGASTTTDIVVTGGGLPSATGPGGITLWRVRFAANTTTAALRNVCVAVNDNNASHITPSDTLPAVPAATDTFFIERPGVLYQTVKIVNPANSVVLRGIGTTAAAGVPWTALALSSMTKVFCESRGDTSVNESGVTGMSVSPTYFSIAPTVVASGLGMGFRAQGQWGVSLFRSFSGINCGSVVGQNHGTFQSSFTGIPRFSMVGQVFNGPVILVQLGQGSAFEPTDPRAASMQATWGGAVTTRAKWRVYNFGGGVGLDIQSCSLLVRDGDIVENVASPASGEIRVSGVGNALVLSNISGGQATGSTGVDARLAVASKIVMLGCTVGQASGQEVLLFGNVFQRHADFTLTNIIDKAGNDLQGSAGHVVDACQLFTAADADGIDFGTPVLISATSSVLHADAELYGNARCMGIACSRGPGGASQPIYVATSGKPWVLNTGGTITPGAPAYLATGPGGIGVAKDGPVPSGKYQQQLGVWDGGTDGIGGYLVFNPDPQPAFVDVIVAASGSVGDGADFTIPTGMSAYLGVSMETGALADDELDWGVVGNNLNFYLRKSGAAPGVHKTRWLNFLGHDVTVRCKWTFR